MPLSIGPLFLNPKLKRKLRADLLDFLVNLELLVLAGHELSSAWNLALESLENSPNQSALQFALEGSFLEHIHNLARHFPLPEARPWFSTLAETYRHGSSLAPLLKIFADTLLDLQNLELEHHVRTLPSKAQVILMIFFLPPFMLLLAYPLFQALNLD